MPSHLTESGTRRRLLAGRGRGPGGQVGRFAAPASHCPVPGCGEVIDGSRLMCRRDWYAIPRPVRDRVWATWRSGRGAHGSEHQQAVRVAIAVSLAARYQPAAGS